MAVLPERRQGIIFTHAKPYIPAPGTIGVCGAGAGVGTTHLCIAIANYLCSKFYSSTAYLEMNASHEIRALAGRPDHGSSFRHQRIEYYPDMTLSYAQKILAGHYRYYVLDFGCPGPHTLREFDKCDHRLIIGCAGAWKATQYRKFVEHTINNPYREEDYLYIGNFMGCKNDIELLSHAFGARVIPMPYLSDPFHVASSYFGFFEDILRRRH
ncbi:MAG: hypothetical protein NC355_00525 [Blautia sp.]|nr:hypothetical protein [Blautia sp.]